MYYGKRKKFLGEPPYDSGGSSIPAAPSSGIPPAPRPQPGSHIAKPIYQSPAAQPYNPYSAPGNQLVFNTGTNVGPARPVQMQPVPQKPVQPTQQRPAAPAYVPPTQATYDTTQQLVDQAYAPVASNLPQYNPAVAAQQAAEKQAQAAAAAAQTTYIQPQYAPAQPAQPRPSVKDRRAQAEQRRRDMEARRKQQKDAQEKVAKARREAQTKAQRKAQDEYNKQQKKAYENQKRADEAYVKQLESQEKAAQKRAEEQAKLAKKAAEQNAKQIAAQQQQYQQQQAALQRQTEETRAKVEAAAQPNQTYAPISAAPSQPLPSDYPGGSAPPKLVTPQAQALAQKIYFTNKDVAATQKQWGDGSSEYTVSSGDRLLKEIMRRGAELEKMKSIRSSMTPNQRKLANSVLHSTQKELEKMAGDIASGYSTATAASFDSARYGEAVSDLASTWNSKFNEMVQRVDLLQQMQNPALAPDAYAQLQHKLSDEERTKFNRALAYEAAPQIIKAADKIVADPSSGFFDNLFASLVASPKAQAQRSEAAQVQAQAQRPGEDYVAKVTPQVAPIEFTGEPIGFQPPGAIEQAALSMQHSQPYFDINPMAIETAVAPMPSVEQQSVAAAAEVQRALQQSEADAAAVRQRFNADQQLATRDFNYFNPQEHPQSPDVEKTYEPAQVEQFIQSAWQQGMSPLQFNKHYGPGYPEALLSTTEQSLRDRRVKEAEQMVAAAKKQRMSPQQFNQHYGPGYYPEEITRAEQNVAMQPEPAAAGYVGPVGPAGVTGGGGTKSDFLDSLFGATHTARDAVSVSKLVTSPVSLLDPKNVGPKLFDLNRPGHFTPRVSAVPIDFLMRSGKDLVTPYVQDAAQAVVGPEYQQEARDAAAAGTKWVGKAIVDTPAGDVARTYATEYVFERGPIGNTFGTVAKNFGGKARGLIQAVPGAAQVGEASYGILRTLLNPKVTAAGAVASGVYDSYRIQQAASEASEAMDAAERQQRQTQRVDAINYGQMQADERKLATAQRSLQHRISLYEDALSRGDFFVPQQSADHFRRQDLKQQMRDKLPELYRKLEQTTTQLQDLRANMQSQPAMSPIFAEEAKARAESDAIDQANMPVWDVYGGF